MATYDEWTIQQAKERIAEPTRGHQQNEAYLAGDHWQGGAGWIGPMLEGNEPGYAQANAKVERSFVARNVIGEVVDNHIAGVLGRPPHFTVTLRRALEEGDEPTQDEQALIDEAGALLREWWDSGRAVTRRYADNTQLRLCSVHELLQEAGKSLLATSRALLRVVIDPDYIERSDDGASAIPVFGSIADAFNALYVSHPAPSQATVTLDRGLNAAGIYAYRDEAEDGSDGPEVVELCYLDDAGDTVIRLLSGDASQQTSPLQLGGRLTMYEMERPLFLTEPLRLLQKAVNLTVTLASRNLVSGGFLERLFLNTSKPGQWDWDAQQGRFIHTPADIIRLGEGTTNFLYGLPMYDERGAITGYTNPSVMFRDPVDSDTFIAMERAFYRAMLEEGKQTHTLISGDATASGESRIQAKDTFRNSLLQTKPQFDAAIRWLLETLLALASDLAGQPGYFAELRINADTQVSLGIASGDEVRSVIEAYNAGLLSRPAAMRRIGVDDVNAMAEAVDSDAMSLLMWLEKKAAVYQMLAAAGALNEGAILDMLGVSKDTVAALTNSPLAAGRVAQQWVSAGATLEGAARAAGVNGETLEAILRGDMVDEVEQ